MDMQRRVEVQRGRRPAMRRPLQGRVALVTDGARGIGRGIATELLCAGAHVVIGDLAEDEMRQTCEELRRFGPVDWVLLDVANHDSRTDAIAEIRREHGPIEILVNNAGIAGAGFFADEDPRRIAKALSVDLAGAICLTRMVLPGMVAGRWGRVANVSSMMALTGSPGFAVYSAAKAGLLAFSEAIEREVRRVGDIRVTAVLPPSVRTSAFEDAKRGEPGMMRWSLVPPVSVKRVARRTVHGLIVGRRHVYCGLQSYLVSLLQRFLPGLMDAILMFMFVGKMGPQLPAPGAGARAGTGASTSVPAASA
jgi:NAD(P)-dependent dehydrogenase (short-subunit alcohol dehydrogenase family)